MVKSPRRSYSPGMGALALNQSVENNKGQEKSLKGNGIKSRVTKKKK